MRTARILAALPLVALLMGSASCGRDSGRGSERAGEDVPSATASPTPKPARIGEPFRNGSFEVTITKVESGVKEMPLDKTATEGGLKPFTPENGQFVFVYLSAKNVGNEPASMSITNATITDAAGKTYEASGPYLGGVANNDLSDSTNQQPDTTRTGFITFDVPLMAKDFKTMTVQSDAYIATTNPPSTVVLS
jgi:hypothetical protein